MVDTGNGSSLSFVKGGRGGSYRHRDIAAVMFTHLHQDHVNDYFDLVTTRWGEGGKRLELIGPPGTGELHRFLTRFFRDDLLYRWLVGAAVGVDEEGMFKGVDVRELTGANEFSLGGMRVTTAEMTHSMYDLAYRFDAEEKAIVVSGDTAFDPRLIALSSGADVLVIDANPWADGTKPPPPRRSLAELPAEYQQRVPYQGDPDAPNHMPLPDVVRVATEARVGTVVLDPSLAAAGGRGADRANRGGVCRRGVQGPGRVRRGRPGGGGMTAETESSTHSPIVEADR